MSDIAANERQVQLERQAHEAVSLTDVPGADRRTDVYEVFGATARSSGWDYTVCQSLSEALRIIEYDLDALEEGEELRIVYRKYSAAMMEDVIFDD